MPRAVFGSSSYRSSGIEVIPGLYQYPEGLSLEPDSPLHRKLLRFAMDLASTGHETVEKRYSSWRAVDKTLCAYMPTDEAEDLIKAKDPRKPISIVYPYSYAILETLVSFMDANFLKNPIFKFEGSTPEDTYGAAILEKVIDIHLKRSKALLSLHTSFRDGLAYGLGAAFPMWKEIWGFKTMKMSDGMGGVVSVREPKKLFEGNAIDNVDPYMLLLDPSFGVKNIQSSEFVGFVRTTNFYDLLEAESTNPLMFNVKYIKQLQSARTSIVSTDESERSIRGGSRKNEAETGKTRPVDLIYIYCKLIPAEMGLGQSDLPEKWMICVAADSLIIQAQPLGTDHNMFPVALCAPTSDGYTVSPLSRIEMISGLQGVVDWLFNSHITNVRKAVNDAIVVDPYAINISDLADPQPGKIIRARRSMWGKDLRGSIQQLGINDVTRAHIADTQILTQQMGMLAGADDAAMGMLRQGGPERLTGQEFIGTRQASLGRLESIARIVSSQMLYDLAYMLASHTQQLMTDDMWIDVSGRYSEVLTTRYGAQIQMGKMKVRPEELWIDFDINPADYSYSKDQDAQLWNQLFQTVASQPELNQMFDITKIFKYVAELMGAPNVDDFVRDQVIMNQVQPTEDVMSQAQAGNVVPIQEVQNALLG